MDNQTSHQQPNFVARLRGVAFGIMGLFVSVLVTVLVILDIILCFIFPFLKKYNLLRRFLLNLSFFVPRIAGIKVEIRGQENIPAQGAVFLSKHMSMYETCVISLLPRMKTMPRSELRYIPLWGQIIQHMGCVWINRGGGLSSLLKMMSQVEAAVKNGDRLVMFPEGTRTAYGKENKMKLGIMQLHPRVRFVPVALNFGLPFGKKMWSPKSSGTAVIEIMPPIATNVDIETARELAESLIREQSDKLCREFLQERNAKLHKGAKRATGGDLAPITDSKQAQ